MKGWETDLVFILCNYVNALFVIVQFLLPNICEQLHYIIETTMHSGTFVYNVTNERQDLEGSSVIVTSHCKMIPLACLSPTPLFFSFKLVIQSI